MSELEASMAAWTDAFVEAEAEGREVELFSSTVGGEAPVQPDWACIGIAHSLECEWVAGEARYVPSWLAYATLCTSCAGVYGERRRV